MLKDLNGWGNVYRATMDDSGGEKKVVEETPVGLNRIKRVFLLL